MILGTLKKVVITFLDALEKVVTNYLYRVIYHVACLVPCIVFIIAIKLKIQPQFQESSLNDDVNNAKRALIFFSLSAVFEITACIPPLEMEGDVYYISQTATIVILLLHIAMFTFGIVVTTYTIAWWEYFGSKGQMCEASFSLAMFLYWAIVQIIGLIGTPVFFRRGYLNWQKHQTKRRGKEYIVRLPWNGSESESE